MDDLFNRVELTQKIERCHKSVKWLFGEEFEEHIKTYKNYIYAYMKKHKEKEVLLAVLGLGNDVKEMQGSETFIVNLFAAAAEIILKDES